MTNENKKTQKSNGIELIVAKIIVCLLLVCGKLLDT